MADTQQSIFDVMHSLSSEDTKSHKKIEKSFEWVVRIDGASRGNPGHAGVGIFITKNGLVYQKHGYYIGKKTNNEAEYLALVLALFLVKDVIAPKDMLTIISDSELLIKQMKRIYKIKKPELQTLFTCAQTLLGFLQPTFKHVLREYNQQADTLANQGVDTKKTVPLTFLDFLAKHNYYIT